MALEYGAFFDAAICHILLGLNQVLVSLLPRVSQQLTASFDRFFIANLYRNVVGEFRLFLDSGLKWPLNLVLQNVLDVPRGRHRRFQCVAPGFQCNLRLNSLCLIRLHCLRLLLCLRLLIILLLDSWPIKGLSASLAFKGLSLLLIAGCSLWRGRLRDVLKGDLFVLVGLPVVRIDFTLLSEFRLSAGESVV